MKLPVLCLAVLSSTLAVPNGYYHQEYNYKTSSSSFKNNELQHKTDDQGYYKKDGDLEGHSKPRVDSNSEHSEYVNPNLRNSQYGSQYAASGYGGGSDLNSLGQMRATNEYRGYDANSMAVDGLAHNDRIVGSRGYSSGYSAGYGANSYGSSSSSSSSSSAANLQLITSRLQQDLENDLRETIRQNNLYAQSRVDIAQLERELRQNLTERLNNELIARYGQQMIRNGMSYSLDGGRLHSTANYNNQELADLKSQVENTLMNRLRTEFYSSSSSNQYHNQQNQEAGYIYSTTPRTVYRPIYPLLPSTTPRYSMEYSTHPSYSTHSNYQTAKSNYQTVNANTRYTPVLQPESITSIATRVQNQMDQQLNQMLDEAKTKYFSSSAAYSLTNTDVLLERLRNELRSNLTYLLDENIRRNYGTQQQRDGYMYSLGPGGQTSSEHNYALQDLENLKAQVERNLINKLNRDIEGYRSSWSSHQSYSSQSSYGTNYESSSSPRYDYYSNPNYNVYTTPRSAIYSVYTTPSAHAAAYVKNGGNYNYLEGSRHSGYESQSSGNMAQLQRNLQDQLSRQLQAAINQEEHSSYSTSAGGYSPTNYQSSLQELSNELNRNLTRNLQEYSASGSYAAYGNFDSAQMERLRAQLQDSLMTQLRQGLQRSFESHSSYSSSGSSNYRQVRGFQDQGQYRSAHQLTDGEDCDGHQSYRAKRSYSPHSYANQEVGQQIELGQQLESTDSFQEMQNQMEFGQQVEEDAGYGKLQSLNQDQSPEYTGYGKLQLSYQEPIGQQIDESDFSQVEDTGNSKLGAQRPMDSGYGRLQMSNQHQMNDLDLTQQLEEHPSEFGLQVEGENTRGTLQGQKIMQETQHFEENISKLHFQHGHWLEKDNTGNGKLQITNQEPLGKQAEDTHYYSQAEEYGYRGIQSHGQHLSSLQLGQQVHDSELTQQVEEMQSPIEFGQVLQETSTNKFTGQKIKHFNENIDQFQSPLELGQQVENGVDGYEKLQITNQEPLGQQTKVEEDEYREMPTHSQHQSLLELGQQVDDSELTQQVEEVQNPIEFGQFQEETSTDKFTGQKITHFNENIDQFQSSSEHGQHVEHDSGKLQITNQEPLGQKTEELYYSPQEEYGYRGVQSQHQNPIELGQQIEEEDNGQEKLQFSHQAPLAQQIDDSELTQQVEEMGNPAKSSQEVHEIEGTSTEKLVGVKLEHFNEHVDGGISKFHDHSENQSPLGVGPVGNGQLGQQTERISVNLDQHVNELIEPEPLNGQQNPTVQNGIVQFNEDQNYEDLSKWCDKYVDTSLMDAPWFLGRELKENITKLLSQNGGNKADMSDVQRKVMEGIPKEMLMKCFQVEPKDKEIVLEGLQKYFDELIKNEIFRDLEEMTILDENPEMKSPGNVLHIPTDNQIVQEPIGEPQSQNKITPNQEKIETSTEVSIDFDNWCKQYVDLSLMDVPWDLSKILKNSIKEQVAEVDNPETAYKIVLEGIPKDMLRKCFRIETIEPNEQVLVLAGIEDYFQSLITRNIEGTIKANNQNRLNERDSDLQKVFEDNHNLPTTNQGQMAKLPPPSGSVPLDQDSKHNQITPQTLAEAEQTADALIEALRQKTQNRPAIVSEVSGYGRRPQPHPYESPYMHSIYHRVQEQNVNSEDKYTPYANTNSYDLRNTRRYEDNHRHVHHYSMEHHVPRYPASDSYSTYHQRPENFHRSSHALENLGTGGSYDYNHHMPHHHQYPGQESYGLYHQRPQVPSPYHLYAQRPVVEHNVESASNIRQLNEGNVNYLAPIQRRPVYSGIKGRRISHPMMQKPIQVQELLQEPLQVQEPAQEQVQKLIQEPAQKLLQEPIRTSVGMDPSIDPSTKKSDIETEESNKSEQIEVTPVPTPEEESWWRKFGNKVKQGAQNLKQKIIG